MIYAIPGIVGKGTETPLVNVFHLWSMIFWNGLYLLPVWFILVYIGRHFGKGKRDFCSFGGQPINKKWHMKHYLMA